MIPYYIDIFANEGFVWKTTISRLEDNFSLHNLAYNYVAWFDDAVRDSISNMGRFKQIVTDDEVNFRAMYSQSEVKLPKTATFIGTSNLHARELMSDTTGIRRLHEIRVNNGSISAGKAINLKDLETFDYLSLYKTCPLGERSPLFYYITEEELSRYEEDQRPKHCVELWILDSKISPEGEDIVSSKELYDNFKIWARDNGYGSKFIPTNQSFSMKLSEVGFKKGRIGNKRGFYMKNNNELST